MMCCASEQVADADRFAKVRRCVIVQLTVHTGNPALDQADIHKGIHVRETSIPYGQVVWASKQWTTIMAGPPHSHGSLSSLHAAYLHLT